MGLVLSFEPAAITKGGTQAMTDALISAGRKLGIDYFTNQDVDRIIVENGRATGVETAEGARFDAPLIVSDLGQSIETGRGTDFVILTRGEEQARASIAKYIA